LTKRSTEGADVAALLLEGGWAVDPGAPARDQSAIAFDGRTVVAEAPPGATVLDVAGNLVVPGMVDLHGHFFRGGFPFGLDPDVHAARSGVVAMVDAGSAGWANYPAFRDSVIRPSRADVYAFLNISASGLVSRTVGIGELADLRLADPVGLRATIEGAGPDVLGIKVRLTLECGEPDVLRAAFDRACAVRDETGCRLMVHVCGSPIPLDEVLPRLRNGDVLSHYLHDGEHGILAPDGTIRDDVLDARERGVLLEVGHGGIHVGHEVVRTAAAHDLWPDIISTDAHRSPAGRDVPTLAETVALFLELGMPLTAAIAAVTVTPAGVVGDRALMSGLRPGSARSATVLEWVDEPRAFTDRSGDELVARRSLRVRHRVVNGVLVDDAPPDRDPETVALFDSARGEYADA
jgi:dihydroorotase